MKPFYAVCAAEGCDAEFVVESFNPANRYFCPACYESWRNAVAEYRVCASCHRPFALRNFERRDNPRSCPECRKREREAALQPADALCGPEPEKARPSDAFRGAPADSPSSQRPAFYKTLKAMCGKYARARPLPTGRLEAAGRRADAFSAGRFFTQKKGAPY